MGTWGTGPLSNDTALDLMDIVSKVDEETLGTMVGLMLHSVKEEEAVLGAYIMYVYYTGDMSDVSHCEGFFKKVSELESQFLECYKPEAVSKLMWLKQNIKRNWFRDKDRSDYSLFLGKMGDAIKVAKNKWKDPLFKD